LCDRLRLPIRAANAGGYSTSWQLGADRSDEHLRDGRRPMEKTPLSKPVRRRRSVLAARLPLHDHHVDLPYGHNDVHLPVRPPVRPARKRHRLLLLLLLLLHIDLHNRPGRRHAEQRHVRSDDHDSVLLRHASDEGRSQTGHDHLRRGGCVAPSSGRAAERSHYPLGAYVHQVGRSRLRASFRTSESDGEKGDCLAPGRKISMRGASEVRSSSRTELTWRLIWLNSALKSLFASNCYNHTAISKWAGLWLIIGGILVANIPTLQTLPFAMHIRQRNQRISSMLEFSKTAV
uniref:ABC transmembrane type-1 domain-containing protein n=1 Tax=Heligmosomoides polygyrus TaxID=6339 RepID=A0A183G2I5_HELPZ